MKQWPVEVGDKATVSIESISHQGEGVGKIDGLTVFVPFSAPGDVLQAEVVSVKPNYARAVIHSIIKPGRRVEPPCPWFGACGGCSVQHLDYDDQLTFKTAVVKDALERIGKIDSLCVREILPTEPWNYRNKLQHPVAFLQGRLTIGMYRSRTNQLVPVEGCPIQMEPTNVVARKAAVVARETGITPWQGKEGLLRHILCRYGPATGQLMLVLVVSTLDFPLRQQLVKGLREQLPQVDCLVLNENNRPDNVILGSREEVVWGLGYITDKLGGLEFKISASSFWQVNSMGAELIVEKVREYAGLSGTETVLDIYCGTGSIGLNLAANAGQVIGIESNSRAVKDAKENAKRNDIENTSFHCGRAETLLPQLIERDISADVAVLDPPRKGCDARLLEAVAAAKPQRIVYVSCNPATLARDLALLKEKGYEIKEVQSLDMFPQTHHVECVVLMSRVVNKD